MVKHTNKNDITLSSYSGESALTGMKKFTSGNNVIDKFVQKGSLRSQAKAPGNTVVVLTDENNNCIVGFSTLSCHSLSKENFQNELTGDVGKTKKIPVVKLTMLGVNKQYQGLGLGRQLMRNALERTKRISQEIGCAGLYLEADPKAVDFYSNLGFIALDKPAKDTGIVAMFLHVDGIP
ncbi:MAG: GNAT family N-acetyltransferase [Pseudomonadota bacterium]|nr:GNAT family N-acetyltransferase [Pseudomonadota bacterium]